MSPSDPRAQEGSGGASNQNTTQSPPAQPFKVVRCKYHDAVLRMKGGIGQAGQGLAVMDRFMREGSGQQCAVLVRPDTGTLSIWKDCSCKQKIEEKL